MNNIEINTVLQNVDDEQWHQVQIITIDGIFVNIYIDGKKQYSNEL